MLTTVYPIQRLGMGQLGMMPKPSTNGNAVHAFELLAAMGTTYVVSLLDESEAQELGFSDECLWCTQCGLGFIHEPVADFTLPKDPSAFVAAMVRIYTLITDGEKVLLHCRAGIGRSGMAAATILMHHGLSASAAISSVSKARGTPIPDTEQQAEFIYSLSEFINN